MTEYTTHTKCGSIVEVGLAEGDDVTLYVICRTCDDYVPADEISGADATEVFYLVPAPRPVEVETSAPSDHVQDSDEDDQ